MHHSPHTMHHTPYTMYHRHYTIHHSPCTLHHTQCTIHHAPYTIHHAQCTMHNTPFTIHHTTCTTHHIQYTPYTIPVVVLAETYCLPVTIPAETAFCIRAPTRNADSVWSRRQGQRQVGLQIEAAEVLKQRQRRPLVAAERLGLPWLPVLCPLDQKNDSRKRERRLQLSWMPLLLTLGCG